MLYRANKDASAVSGEFQIGPGFIEDKAIETTIGVHLFKLVRQLRITPDVTVHADRNIMLLAGLDHLLSDWITPKNRSEGGRELAQHRLIQQTFFDPGS